MKRQTLAQFDSVTGGFTALEVLVTVLLMGILAAIAAPNWLAFMNQQRVGAARNQVAQAIRNAQSEAQRTKISRAIVFRTNNSQPQYAIVPAPNDTVTVSTINNWQSLGDGNVRPGTIRLSVNQGTNASEPPPLIFNSYGSVVIANSIALPYTITIGSISSANPRRCVAVETLLGATREGADKTESDNDGCPPNRV